MRGSSEFDLLSVTARACKAIEGAALPRVPSLVEIANGWRKNVEAAQRLAAQPPPETRECEGCGQRKPIEEMQTCFLPGTGETYQCEQCRGVTP